MVTVAEIPCVVHRYHSPRPQESDLHHVWPKSWGGPDDDDNLLPICQTGHANIHRLLTALRATGGVLTWVELREFGAAERRVALAGYAAWSADEMDNA